jgi:hypothetical protein
MSGKWLELLKQIASPVARVAVIRDPEIPWRGQPAQGARLAAYSRMLPTEKNNVVLERNIGSASASPALETPASETSTSDTAYTVRCRGTKT